MFGSMSLVGKAISLGLMLILLSGGGYFVVAKIKGCVRAEDRAATLEKAREQTQEIQNADQKSQQNLREMTDEELAEFGRTGVLPERLRRAAD